MEKQKFYHNLEVIEDHLAKNEHYFRNPEQKLMPLFTDIEEHMNVLEKAFDNW